MQVIRLSTLPEVSQEEAHSELRQLHRAPRRAAHRPEGIHWLSDSRREMPSTDRPGFCEYRNSLKPGSVGRLYQFESEVLTATSHWFRTPMAAPVGGLFPHEGEPEPDMVGYHWATGNQRVVPTGAMSPFLTDRHPGVNAALRVLVALNDDV